MLSACWKMGFIQVIGKGPSGRGALSMGSCLISFCWQDGSHGMKLRKDLGQDKKGSAIASGSKKKAHAALS